MRKKQFSATSLIWLLYFFVISFLFISKKHNKAIPSTYLRRINCSDLIYELGRNIENIEIKVPIITLYNELRNCSVCNVRIKKIKFQNPGNFDDCLLTSYYILNPGGKVETLVGDFDKFSLIRTTRLFNQKSQFIIFTNYDLFKYDRNIFDIYKACNANFIQVFQIKFRIERGVIFILRNAVYYEFLMANKHQVNRIMTFDFSDTIFLEDPFGVIKNDSLYITLENYTLKEGYFAEAVHKLNQKFSKQMCDLSRSKMINGGFMAGHHKYVSKYLLIFLNYFLKNKSYAEDQFYFNYIVYCRRITEFKVTVLDHSDGFIHYCFHHSKINSFPPNETYPIFYLHQWNRKDCKGEYTMFLEKMSNK